MTEFLSNPDRRYSPTFRVENYNFKVIVDPVGNPNVYFLEPGVSVYLACSLATTPLVSGATGAGGAAEELLAAGAGFPEALAAAAAAVGSPPPPGVVDAANPNPALAAAAAAALANINVNGGGVGNPPGDWECCCAFSLTACNQQRKGRNVTWHSSMLNDRFHKNRKNWGVHSLLPLTKLKDPASGFVVEDSLKLKVRLRLLYLTVKVVRTTSLAAHQGFGVVDTGADAESENTLTYELFHCTTLAAFKQMLVRDLDVASPEHLRLWVFTQPWPDTVLCPREILVNEASSSTAAAAVANGAQPAPPAQPGQNNNNPPAPADAAQQAAPQPPANPNPDDDLSSPTLFSLLQLHMDGLGVARVWAECSGDGGFTSTGVPVAQGHAESIPNEEDADDEEEEEHAGFDVDEEAEYSQLSAIMATSSQAEDERNEEAAYSQEEEEEEMYEEYAYTDAMGGGGIPFPRLPGLRRCREPQALPPVPLMPDSRDLSHHAHTAQTAAAAAGTAPPALPPAPSSDMHVLVFLKWLNPVTGRLAYLTHAVVKHSTPLHHLFALVGGLTQQSPEALSAHVETTPATWQPGSHSMHRMLSCPSKQLCVGGEEEDGMQEGGEASGGQTTLRDAGLENGQILIFHLSSQQEEVEETYRGYLERLFREACLMYYGGDAAKAAAKARSIFANEGNKGRGGRGGGKGKAAGGVTAAGATTEEEEEEEDAVAAASSSQAMVVASLPKHATLKLEHVVNLFERFGYQSFRVRNVYYQHKHMNARQTLEYVIQGRHLGFCCDRCGATDFTGPRFKCLSCYDYGTSSFPSSSSFSPCLDSLTHPPTYLPTDLCGNCQEHPQAAAHRYKYEHRGWRRENQFGEHAKTHNMHMILPVPHNLRLLTQG